MTDIVKKDCPSNVKVLKQNLPGKKEKAERDHDQKRIANTFLMKTKVDQAPKVSHQEKEESPERREHSVYPYMLATIGMSSKDVQSKRVFLDSRVI